MKQFNKVRPLAAILLCAGALSLSVHAEEKVKPVAKTEKAASAAATIYPQSHFDYLIKEQTTAGRPDNEELRNAIKEELTNRELLVREAKKKGLDKDSGLKIQMEMANQGILIQKYLQDFVKNNPPAEEDLKKEYEKIKAQLGDKEYKARHILVDKEEDAKEIIAALQKGEKFEKLAKEKSKDPGSKERGGELDWASPANYVKPFSDAMTKLEKGKFTAVPVKSDFGWHVIQLEDSRDAKHPPYEELKPRLQQQLQGSVVQKHIESLRAKAKL